MVIQKMKAAITSSSASITFLDYCIEIFNMALIFYYAWCYFCNKDYFFKTSSPISYYLRYSNVELLRVISKRAMHIRKKRYLLTTDVRELWMQYLLIYVATSTQHYLSMELRCGKAYHNTKKQKSFV